ncbi:MAG: DNRLRE domain-containing protein [Myxococcota bacterium]|nr:DNRLRE domain-containing protein [Myxococcota bacterium]
MTKKTSSLLLLFLSLFLIVGSARSDEFTVNSGVDVSPYEFLPTLSREGYTTLYVFDEENFHDFEAYIQFDLSGVVIPPDQQVVSATFVICYCFDYTAFGDTSQVPATVTLHEVTEAWDPNLVTWSNRPAALQLIDQVDSILNFGPMIFDVTPLAQGWLDGTDPNYGLALKSPTARVIGMHSFESTASAALKATLLIQTEAIPPVPLLGPAGLILLTGALAGVGGFQLQRRGRLS